MRGRAPVSGRCSCWSRTAAHPRGRTTAGPFELPRVEAGPRRLYVSVVGYILVRRDVQVERGAALTVTIPLSEGTGTYTETVTVDGGSLPSAEPAVAAQQVLGSADIQNLRGVLADDPLRAVQVLPGVATGDDLRSEFSVRGSQFSHMNMTVDGFSTPFLLHTVRAVEDASASGSVAMINSDVLEDVTLLNGGYAQRYGDRTGAEVDFRLREGSRERRQARVAVSGTSASLVLEGPIGGARRGSWLMSARQSYLDLVVDRIYEEGEGVNFGFSDAQAKFVFDMTPAQRAELTLIAGRSKLEERRQDLDADDFFTGRNASAIAIGTWRYTAPRGILTGRLLASLNRFSNHAADAGDARRRTRRAGSGPDRRERHRGRAGCSSMRARRRSGPTRPGMRQRFTQGRYRVINEFGGRATRTGGFAQLRWTAGPLTLVPGARADRWSLTGETTTSPWLQGDWKLTSVDVGSRRRGRVSSVPGFRAGHRLARAARRESAARDAVRSRIRAAPRASRCDGRSRCTTARSTGSSAVPAPRRGWFSAASCAARRRRRFSRASTATPAASSCSCSGRARAAYRDGSRIRSAAIASATGRPTRPTGAISTSATRCNLYVFYRISDRTSVSAKLRAGSNVPAPGYYAQAGERILRLLVAQRGAPADVFARRPARQPHVQLVAQAPDALRGDHERAQPRQRPLQPAGRQHRHGPRLGTLRIDDPDRALGGDTDRVLRVRPDSAGFHRGSAAGSRSNWRRSASRTPNRRTSNRAELNSRNRTQWNPRGTLWNPVEPRLV